MPSEQKRLFDERGQRRIGKPAQADKRYGNSDKPLSTTVVSTKENSLNVQHIDP